MIQKRCLPTGLRLLVRAHEEIVLEEAEEVLAEVFVGVLCCLGEGRGPDVAGNDQHGCDMADLKMDSLRRTKMIQLNHLDLSHKDALTFVRACEQTVCSLCTLWVCILCTDIVVVSSSIAKENVLRSRPPVTLAWCATLACSPCMRS